MLLALPSFENVTPLFQRVRSTVSEILSAFEYFDRDVYELALKHGHVPPFQGDEAAGAKCFVLVETSGSKKEHDEEVLLFILDAYGVSFLPNRKSMNSSRPSWVKKNPLS
jgi:(R)-2-hydroxyglutarate---pyruvate transhydrogenase